MTIFLGIFRNVNNVRSFDERRPFPRLSRVFPPGTYKTSLWFSPEGRGVKVWVRVVEIVVDVSEFLRRDFNRGVVVLGV